MADFHLPPTFAAPTQVTMTPMNDIQVVALIAAGMLPHMGAMGTPRDAVDAAIELLAESVLRAKSGRLQQRIRELEAERAVVADV